MTTLSIAVAQPESVLHDVVANVAAHVDAVDRAESRVVVFPELSLTGYSNDAGVVDPGDDRLEPLVEACRDAGSIALVGAPVPAGGAGRSLATLLVDGSGATVAYRKMFLGGDESAAYLPGTEPATIVVDGWRLGLAICRDTGVAEHADRTAVLGIDAYVAGVCDLATDRDVQLERARRIARHHGVWVAVASFAGPTGGGFDDTAGRSFVIDPDGVIADRAGRETGAVVATVIASR